MEFNLPDFKKVVSWLINENMLLPRIGLLGGEPTLHPNFIEFLDHLLSKKINTVVFTNGMIENTKIYDDIIDVALKNEIKHANSFGFCLNVNEKKYRTKKEDILQKRFLEELGRVSTLSFNIFEPDFDPYFLLEIILQHKCMKNIRIGLASPLGNRNKFLKTKDFKVVGDKLSEFIRETSRNDVIVGFDCGFVRCMFPDNIGKELLKVEGWGHYCHPTIDVYPNLEVAYCYPLSKILKARMEDWKTSMDLYIHWSKEIRKYELIYDQCPDCKYLSTETCDGGCKAHKANG